MKPSWYVETCRCTRCVDYARLSAPAQFANHWDNHDFTNFRYACEVCGNKRCPHHSDHTLACANSNEPGQPGSKYK